MSRVIDDLKSIVESLEDQEQHAASFQFIVEIRSHNGERWSYYVGSKGKPVGGGGGSTYSDCLERVQKLIKIARKEQSVKHS